MSYPQIIIILKIFKNLFACKIVLAANHQYLGNIQKLFRLQNCLSRKSSLSWKYSKTFSPGKLSSTQIINILKTFKDFFPCKVLLVPNHHSPESIQRLFACKSVVAANHHYHGNFQRLFACKIVLAANQHCPENIQRLFCLQICLIRKSSSSWRYSKTFSPAKLPSPQIIIILKIFKDFFACKIVIDANHHYPENTQDFFASKFALAANQHLSENIQRLIRLQKRLSRKSSLSWKHSKTFSPAKLSPTQIIIILKLFKDFFACKIVLDANHQYPGNIQKLFRLQNCLIRKSSLSWRYSKTFSPAKLPSPQIIIILKIFKDFFACNIVIDANHHYPENTQDFFASKFALAANQHFSENIQRLIRLQKRLSRKSSLSWKHSKTFSPAKMSPTQIIIILKLFKDFFACKIVLDANHQYLGNIQKLFRLQNCLIRKSSLSWKYSKTYSPAKLS